MSICQRWCGGDTLLHQQQKQWQLLYKCVGSMMIYVTVRFSMQQAKDKGQICLMSVTFFAKMDSAFDVAFQWVLLKMPRWPLSSGRNTKRIFDAGNLAHLANLATIVGEHLGAPGVLAAFQIIYSKERAVCWCLLYGGTPRAARNPFIALLSNLPNILRMTLEDGPVAQRISAPTESSVTTSVPAPMARDLPNCGEICGNSATSIH